MRRTAIEWRDVRRTVGAETSQGVRWPEREQVVNEGIGLAA